VGFLATARLSQSDIGANTALEFDKVLTNAGNAYDSATSKFTAPKSGLYYFSFTVLSANNEDADEYHFWKNGADYEVGCFDSGNSYTPCTATAILSLNPGDVVDVRAVYISDIYGSRSRGLSHFVGYLIQSQEVCTTLKPDNPVWTQAKCQATCDNVDNCRTWSAKMCAKMCSVACLCGGTR